MRFSQLIKVQALWAGIDPRNKKRRLHTALGALDLKTQKFIATGYVVHGLEKYISIAPKTAEKHAQVFKHVLTVLREVQTCLAEEYLPMEKDAELENMRLQYIEPVRGQIEISTGFIEYQSFTVPPFVEVVHILRNLLYSDLIEKPKTLLSDIVRESFEIADEVRFEMFKYLTKRGQDLVAISAAKQITLEELDWQLQYLVGTCSKLGDN